jgi:hypothetical protein
MDKGIWNEACEMMQHGIRRLHDHVKEIEALDQHQDCEGCGGRAQREDLSGNEPGASTTFYVRFARSQSYS